jgi:hypothetical protein
MKSASLFEIVAARCWNVLNEGKTFTPVFVLSVFLIANGFTVDPVYFGQAVLLTVPLFLTYYIYDYPLHLRWFLWLPMLMFVIGTGHWNWGLLGWAFGLYVFFTVFFWGTLYYHLRIGTTWWNFTRIWKLFLKNTDSTSGNVFEQLPKVFLQLLFLDWFYSGILTIEGPVRGFKLLVGLYGNFGDEIAVYVAFVAGVFAFSWVIHKWLFNWKPKEYPFYTRDVADTSFNAAITTASNSAGVSKDKPALAKRAVVIVIDGCRKERLEEAETPFLDQLRQNGAYYEQMETVYPARTVVCFSSMFTGTYPREHGIKSNMVWKLGVQVESIFDKLKQHGKKGVLFGCAHLIDSFGDYVESFTAVEKNDVVDYKIMAQAKEIMKRENPDLMVIQMIAVDQTGHSRGVLYPEYLEKISESDALIQDFYQWMDKEGFLDDTTFVIMADHGQGNGIGGHGHLDVGERFVPFIMHGAGIKQGVTVQEHRSIVSLAPTLAQLLGVPYPEHSRGPVLAESIRAEELQHEKTDRSYSCAE